MPSESQQQSAQQTTQQQLPQVTIKLQHHAQLEDNDLNTYRSGFICSDNPFVSNSTTDTFKIKPSANNVRTGIFFRFYQNFFKFYIPMYYLLFLILKSFIYVVIFL